MDNMSELQKTITFTKQLQKNTKIAITVTIAKCKAQDY